MNHCNLYFFFNTFYWEDKIIWRIVKTVLISAIFLTCNFDVLNSLLVCLSVCLSRQFDSTHVRLSVLKLTSVKIFFKYVPLAEGQNPYK